MKILLYCGTVSVITGTGGMEHVLCNMANALLQRGHEVTVACNDTNPGRPFFPLDARIELVNLAFLESPYNHRKKNHLLLKICREILHPLQNLPFFNRISNPFDLERAKQIHPKLSNVLTSLSPEVVVAFSLADASCLTYKTSTVPCPIVIMHHFNPEVGLLKCMRTSLGRETLSKCRYLQLLLPGFERQVKKQTGIETVVIPNAVPQVPDNELADLTAKKEEFRILMIGRIDFNNKRQDFLVRSFSRIAKKYPHWKLEMYGVCSRKRYHTILEWMIRTKGLEDQIKIMQPTDQVFTVLRTGDIFAFPSAFEGFGLALAEAMSVGLPCIGLKTTSAVNELILDGVNGFLTDNNEGAFVEKLEVLMNDAELRSRMGKAGHEMMKQYASEIIWEQWERLLQNAIKLKPVEKSRR